MMPVYDEDRKGDMLRMQDDAWGGNKKLPYELLPSGLLRTVWLPNKEEIETMATGNFGLTVVIDPKQSPHPGISIKVLPLEVVPDPTENPADDK